MRGKRIGSILLLLLGVLSLAYYATCIAWAHIGVSWLWIWPALSVFCFGRCAMLLIEVRRGRPFFPKRVRAVWKVLVCTGLIVFSITEGLIIAAMNHPVPEGLDAIIVLGAAVRGEEPTSPMLLRMARSLAYLQENPEAVVVASGGQGKGESISEAECIRRYLTAQGIDEERILMEPVSRDTQDNIRNSYALLEEHFGEREFSVGLVTSSFHVYRAMLIARQAGRADVCGIAAQTLLPLGFHYTVREFFGVVEQLVRAAIGR